MAASPKLEGEIDGVLKKIQEGIEVFDSILNKVYDNDNANQKEKFKAVRKEIKKLKRYREQIKTCIQSSEIKDRKVSASFELALEDARKQIGCVMERFKIVEEEIKTKALSNEGLGQQSETDLKEKSKSETRDWLNDVIGELESQIDSFEAEIEGLSVKKRKRRPPRLTHLETSITRHKSHIMKLELILRLLDNDELSPDQVNDVKDFVDDYVESNQEDFDEFSDVDELYSSLPLDKVEPPEDLIGPLSNVAPIPGLEASFAAPAYQIPQGSSSQEHVNYTTSQDGNFDIARTPPSESSVINSSAAATPTESLLSPAPVNLPPHSLSGASTPSVVLTCSNSARDVGDTKVEEQPQNLPDDPSSEAVPTSGLAKNPMNEDDLKAPYAIDSPDAVSSSLTEPAHLIRSVSDFGAIGDNLSESTNSGGMHDRLYNLQMLEAAYYKIPRPEDSERARRYTPKHPAATPASYPQVQAPIVYNPAFWEHISVYGHENAIDTLFFAFYFQQNTYQQYLAAKELKKQSWMYHRLYNRWFRRLREPKIANDAYEMGTYEYFDIYLANCHDHGWKVGSDYTGARKS